VLAVVKVAEIILLPLEEDDSQAIESERTTDLIVHDTGTQVESFVILTCCRQVCLLFRQLTHLEVDVRFFEEVSLLDACLCFEYKVLR